MIRRLEKADELELLQLYDLISRQVENIAFFNWTHEKILSELKESVTFIYEWQGQIVSFITFRELPDFIEIMALGTSPTFRKKGFSEAILFELTSYAARQNKSLGLEVHQDNEAARKLYLKWGFKLSRTRVQYYLDGGDALVLIYQKLATS